VIGALRRPASLDAAEAWGVLATVDVGREPAPFDPASVEGLPAPARRWLTSALAPGAPLHGGVILQMRGRIRLGPRWFPFTADQILRAGVGFVWRPVVGGRIVRFEGVDVLAPSEARMEFRLHGRIPVVGASGEDIARSAAGRLAGETVSWLPAAFVPGSGAWAEDDPTWRAVDGDRFVVTVPTPVEPVDVEVTVDAEGRLRSVAMSRWEGSADPPAPAPFGGEFVHEFVDGDGRRLAGSGSVGWRWGTTGWEQGEFFRFEIVGAHAIR